MAVQISGNDITVPRDTTVTRNLTVGGVLTYEDVTNVDSVGIVTARAGVLVGSGITLSKDGDIFATGVTTSTTFVGALTGNVTGNVTGNISGGTVAGSTGTFTGVVTLADGVANGLKIGNGQDLILQHNGTQTFIDNNTGNLTLQTTGSGEDINIESLDDVFIKVHGSENAIRCIGDGAVELYYDNSKKLETTDTGAALTGTLTATGQLTGSSSNSGKYVRLYGGAGTGRWDIYGHGANLRISDNDSTGSVVVDRAVSLGDSVAVRFGASNDLEIQHNGSVNIIDAASSAAISFRRGGSEQFFIGDAEFKGGDNKKIKLGTGDDLQIYFDGSNSYIREPNSVAGQLIIDGYNGTDIRQGSTGEHMIRAIGGGAVELYHNGSLKVSTESDGASTSGLQRFADDSGAVGGFTHCLVSGTISNGNTFTATTHNCHAGGLVTITTNRRPSGSNNKTVKIYPILINSTSNASLGTVVESMTGSSGSSFSVSGTSRGVIVTNTSGLDQRVSVRFDIAGI